MPVNSETFLKYQDDIFEAAPIGMAIVSLDGNVLKVNKAFCSTTGYSPSQLINKNFKWFTYPDDLELNVKQNKEVIRGKIPSHQMEKRYFHKDGHILHILLKVTSLKDEQGKPEYLLAQIVDITQSKSYENLLHGNIEKLIKANNEIDSFIYHASHDLKGPLATIHGLLNLKEAGVPADEIFDRMRSSIAKMDHAISVLSDYTVNNTLQISKEEINLNLYLKAIVSSLSKEALEKNIKVELDAPSIKVCLDVKRIQVILKHIIQNAIYYNDKKSGGYVVIRSNREPKNVLKITIEDNGPGMSDEVKSQAFNMFYRGNESSNGIGMGLYIVKEAICKLEGEINFITTPDEGTRFFITIPIC